MDYNQFEQLGDKLREIGHQRRELAEQVFSEVRTGEKQASKDLLNQLTKVSDEAINIISQQKQVLNQEVNKNLHS